MSGYFRAYERTLGMSIHYPLSTIHHPLCTSPTHVHLDIRYILLPATGHPTRGAVAMHMRSSRFILRPSCIIHCIFYLASCSFVHPDSTHPPPDPDPARTRTRTPTPTPTQVQPQESDEPSASPRGARVLWWILHMVESDARRDGTGRG